jgi:predicted transcriptional regulator YdeE
MHKPVIVERDEIKVIGIAAQTTNEDEMKGNGKIPELWKRYFIQQIERDIPNQKEKNVTLGLYTDYENEVYGSYLMVVGKPVNTFDHMPEGMVAKTLPPSKYAVFTSRQGEISAVVPELWQYIWEWFRDSEMKRTFTGDFELYDEKSIDPHNAQVKIYIAIQSGA